MPVVTRTGAIVFTDVVGFTEFTAQNGDERALALLDRQEELVRLALPSGSRIVKQLGDGLLLYFATVSEALVACLDLLRRYDEESSDDLPLWVRTGLHYGSPKARGDDLIGHDVNLTARISALAGPGEVLVSAAAVDAAGPLPGVSFEPLGLVVVKGIPGAVPLFRALSSWP